MTDDATLGSALTETLQLDSLADLATEYGELGLEEIFAQPVLEHVPVLKTVYAMARAGLTIRDRIFAQKLWRFIMNSAGVSAKDRRQMVGALENDPSYGRRVGEHLIDLLDRVDAHRKPAMLGRAFAALAQGGIDRAGFHRLTTAIEKLPVHEIVSVRIFLDSKPHGNRLDQESLQALVNAGLIAMTTLAPLGGTNVVYSPYQTCQRFVQLELDHVK